MASGTKADLARARTMEATSEEGRAYLEKNLTQWKKPLLLCQQSDVKASSAAGGSGKKRAAPAVSDNSQPGVKRAKMAKFTTMEVTAKEGKELIGGKSLGDTRQVTKSKQKKGKTKRVGTMVQVVAEAKALGSAGSPTSGRSARKRPASAKKPVAKRAAMKKAGTMQATAKEAASLLGKQQLGDTRQVTKARQKQKAKTAKKSSKKSKK